MMYLDIKYIHILRMGDFFSFHKGLFFCTLVFICTLIRDYNNYITERIAMWIFERLSLSCNTILSTWWSTV